MKDKCSTKCLSDNKEAEEVSGREEVRNNNGRPKWVNLFNNSLASYGVPLSYVPPEMKNGKPVIWLRV